MSDNHTEFCNRAGQEVKPRQGLRWRQLALLSAFAIGMLGVGVVLGHPGHQPPWLHSQPGPASCWGNLQGNLSSLPDFVLAVDRNLNVQLFERPGAVRVSRPAGNADVTRTATLTRYNATQRGCYTMGGQDVCY